MFNHVSLQDGITGCQDVGPVWLLQVKSWKEHSNEHTVILQTTIDNSLWNAIVLATSHLLEFFEFIITFIAIFIPAYQPTFQPVSVWETNKFSWNGPM